MIKTNKLIRFLKSNIYISIIEKKNETELVFPKNELENKLLCLEFVEDNEIHVFYILIKIDSNRVLVSNNSILIDDSTFNLNESFFEDEFINRTYSYLDLKDTIKIILPNSFFKGDIKSERLYCNAYIYEKKCSNIMKLVDEKIEKNIKIIILQDLLFQK